LKVPGAAERTIIVDSVSKRFSATGARIGCIASKHAGVMEGVLRFAQTRLSAPTVEQQAIVPMLRDSAAYTTALTTTYRGRRDVVYRRLQEIPGVRVRQPEGAFYIFAVLPIDDGERFASWLLTDFRLEGETLMIAPGDGFYFTPGLVLDPMSGSGTCSDVCQELGVPCLDWDIHRGIDACDPQGFSDAEAFGFIWAHPPYWRQKLYADDPRDLSRAPTLEAFLRRYGQFIRNCARVLKPGGKLAILMGDYSDREAGFVPLTYHTKRLAFAVGLRQNGTDIIRFSHGASSSRKVYRSSFIPGLHDVCMIFEK